MSQVINGQTYSKLGIGTPNGDRYARVVLSASVAGSPAVGTAFSALTVSASITLPDLGINTPISVTGFTRSAGTVAAGSNSMTVTWKGISKVVTFSASADPGTPGISLSQAAVTVTIGAGSWVDVSAALNGGLTGEVEWAISPEDAHIMIGSDGTPNIAKIKALAGATAGAYTLTATLGGHTATCAVTVAEAGGGEDEPGDNWLPEQPTPVSAPAGKTLMATQTQTVPANKMLNGTNSVTYDVTFGAAVDLSDVTHIRITSDMADIANGIYVVVASGLFEKGKGALDSGVTDYNGSPVTVDDGDTIFGTDSNGSGVTLGLTTIAGQTVHYNTGKNGHMIVSVSGRTLTIKVLNINNGTYLRQNQKITVELYGDESA